MKTSLILKSTIILLLVVLFSNCNKKEDNNPFDEEAQKQYDAIISLQQQAEAEFQSLLSTNDSLTAVNKLAEWFKTDATVKQTFISNQGIMILYSNGIRGGFVIDPLRKDDPLLNLLNQENSEVISSEFQKSIPNHKAFALLAASYSEFQDANNFQGQSWSKSAEKAGYTYFMNGGANVNLNYLSTLAELNLAIIGFDSHGIAWPNDLNIDEVYYKSGEQVNGTTTTKFYQSIIDQQVALFTFKNGKTIYCIAPSFITSNNDFSNDTIMFYGGFCYSFLGNWPSIVESCASGTYFGFSWIVRSDKCAYWAKDLVEKLADTLVEEPWNVENWMTNSAIEKSYFDAEYNKNVSIQYNGSGTFALLKPKITVDAEIISLDPSGAPFIVPGMSCQVYTFKCNTSIPLPPQVRFDWQFQSWAGGFDYGYGQQTEYYFPYPGTYTIKVEIIDLQTNEIIKTYSKQAIINEKSFLPELKNLSIFQFELNSSCITLTNGGHPQGSFYFNTTPYSPPLTWSDSSFSASYSNQYFIEGKVSSDGKILKNVKAQIFSTSYDVLLETENIPHHLFDPYNCSSNFEIYLYGTDAQKYVKDISYKEWDGQSYITIQSIDWPNATLHVVFYNN